MTFVKDIKKTATDPTPVYAAVGATDLAIEVVREAGVRAAAVREDLDVTALQGQAVKRAEKVAEQAQQLSALALTQTLEAAGKARETYAELAARGQKLVKRIRYQQSTKDLLAQAGSTISLGKGAVTTVRKAALDTQHAAKATLTTALREAEVVAGTVTGAVRKDAKVTTVAARKSAPAVRLAAKRTATTAKKGAVSTKRATKSAATSASKTATKATTAAKTATPKLGD
jgi:heparin binding hemagglutinin HbhA